MSNIWGSTSSGGGSGEANTASNASTDVDAKSLFYQKSGVDLQFNGIKGSNMTPVSLNAATHTLELKEAIPIQMFWAGVY